MNRVIMEMNRSNERLQWAFGPITGYLVICLLSRELHVVILKWSLHVFENYKVPTGSTDGDKGDYCEEYVTCRHDDALGDRGHCALATQKYNTS